MVLLCRLADGDKDLGSRAGRGIDPHMINPALKKIGDEMRRSHRQLVVHQPHTKSSRANFKFERKIEGRAGTRARAAPVFSRPQNLRRAAPGDLIGL